MSSKNWYKGNIHTHTTESDGDASPEDVTSWYRNHDYDFLVLSDHNHLTLLEYGYSKKRNRKPLMVPGEEVTLRINNGKTAIHINGIGISRVVEPIDAIDVVHTIQANVNAIIEAGGIASINHPNYTWAFDHEALKQVVGASLVEVFNGHHASNNFGAPGKPSCEEIWDGVLSAGKMIYGVAVDDSHNYNDFTPGHSNPGRGWVVVRAEELTVEAIVEGLATGEFYSSSGISLRELEITRDGVSLEIDPMYDFIYTTSFIGKDGQILDQVTGAEASYEIQGEEGYVRAAIRSSSGQKAWTQPVFVE